MLNGDLDADEIEKLLNGENEQHTVRFKTADESTISREFVLGSEIQPKPQKAKSKQDLYANHFVIEPLGPMAPNVAAINEELIKQELENANKKKNKRDKKQVN